VIRCRSILATTVLTVSVVFSLFPEPRASAGSKGLFTESKSAVQFRTQRNSSSLRSRHVKIDFDLLGDARGFRRAPHKGRQSLELNLFPDISFTAVLDKIEPHSKGYSWIGQVQGSQQSVVILTVSDDVMAGNVTLSGTSYQIRHVEAGVHAIREVTPKAARPEGEPIRIGPGQAVPSLGAPSIAPDEGGKLDSSPDPNPFRPDSNISFTVSPDPSSLPQSGSGEFFDLLVVYTPSARSAAEGTAGIESLIQLGVTETNLAYQNSEIISRIRLVHTAEVNYTETGALETDLAYAQLGFVDNTHALRDTYGADLVQLVTDSAAGFCGKAYVMSGNNANFHWWSYSVVEQSCISPNYTFAHEMAHNMGCNHAPGDPQDIGAYPYSLGYKDPSNQFRTLMAYYTGCNCTRVIQADFQSNTAAIRSLECSFSSS